MDSAVKLPLSVNVVSHGFEAVSLAEATWSKLNWIAWCTAGQRCLEPAAIRLYSLAVDSGYQGVGAINHRTRVANETTVEP
ncbi:hypothetical protein CA85_06380 [Allorhodopirellula solitaria]|uniref:Uncharacterized protein n=1 Tax=Allorhodopirellula solitaria TaxID=2527987 RepID=A0A5C5YKH5_9BACT|nr:hypothetical protein CA85_06380 [Allorhodopirellula solitaria]